MRPGKIAKAVVLITLLGFTLAASGCYGGFNLTRNLYKWNGNIEVNDGKNTNEVVQSAVMVLLWAIPVYQIVILADALVINSIQFWTGKNPVQASAEPIIRAVDQGDERYVQTFSHDALGKELRTDYYKKGRYVNTLIVRQEENSLTVAGDLRWGDGRHEAFQVTYAGEETYIIAHTNHAGEQRQWVVPPAEVSSITNRVQMLLASPLAGEADFTGLPLQ
jgi:hypothetical protein